MQVGIVTLAAILLCQANLILARPSWTWEQELKDLLKSVRVENVRDENDVNNELPQYMKDMLYGGDIMLTNRQLQMIEEMEEEQFIEHAIGKRAVVNNFRRLWQNQQVPFVISSNLGPAAQRAIREAIADFERLTCIRFVRRTNQRDFVNFLRASGCWSFIGRTGGRQDISIGQGCETKGIVIHEILHALGRWHEQSRPDRDSFVRIVTQNIQQGRAHNFERVTVGQATVQNIPYDFFSIMHYRLNAFSRNGRNTIEPVVRVDRRRIGQRGDLSQRDIQHVNTQYCRRG